MDGNAGEIVIGILALQGAFSKHGDMLEKLGIKSRFIRYPEDLNHCNGLIIPGGESTTMTHQIKEMNLQTPLKEFAKKHPIFGTCAGMILMAQEGILSLLDISVCRNAYGRQRHSFVTHLPSSFSPQQIPCLFIRAPRITSINSPQVRVLARYNQEPVLVQQGYHLAACFHPELTEDPKIHHYFVNMCYEELCKEKLSHQLP